MNPKLKAEKYKILVHTMYWNPIFIGKYNFNTYWFFIGFMQSCTENQWKINIGRGSNYLAETRSKICIEFRRRALIKFWYKTGYKYSSKTTVLARQNYKTINNYLQTSSWSDLLCSRSTHIDPSSLFRHFNATTLKYSTSNIKAPGKSRFKPYKKSHQHLYIQLVTQMIANREKF